MSHMKAMAAQLGATKESRGSVLLLQAREWVISSLRLYHDTKQQWGVD